MRVPYPRRRVRKPKRRNFDSDTAEWVDDDRDVPIGPGEDK
jgi:hypothetical protein